MKAWRTKSTKEERQKVGGRETLAQGFDNQYIELRPDFLTSQLKMT